MGISLHMPLHVRVIVAFILESDRLGTCVISRMEINLQLMVQHKEDYVNCGHEQLYYVKCSCNHFFYLEY